MENLICTDEMPLNCYRKISQHKYLLSLQETPAKVRLESALYCYFVSNETSQKFVNWLTIQRLDSQIWEKLNESKEYTAFQESLRRD